MTSEISLEKMQKIIDEIEALGNQEYYGIECPECKNRCFGISYDKDRFIKFYCDGCDQPYKINKKNVCITEFKEEQCQKPSKQKC